MVGGFITKSYLGWRFTAWGPPDFYKIETGTDADPGIEGALQRRRALVAGRATLTPECTFAVDDVDAVAAAVRDPVTASPSGMRRGRGSYPATMAGHLRVPRSAHRASRRQD